jgi:ATP-dependent Clp protease, protease subunit
VPDHKDLSVINQSTTPVYRAKLSPFASKPQTRLKATEEDDDEPAATAGMLMLTEKASLDENPFLLDLGTDLNPGSLQSIMSQLMAIGRWFDSTEPAKHKPVRIICNNDGGDVMAAFSILDQLDALKAKGAIIETYVSAQASSGAVAISSHGTKGHRYISPRAFLMLHHARMTTGSGLKPVQEAKAMVDHGNELNHILLEILANNTHGTVSKAQLMKDTRNDFYLGAKQAIAYGLADKIGVPQVEPFDKTA